jgi:hypothetical protein
VKFHGLRHLPPHEDPMSEDGPHIVRQRITIEELRRLAQLRFGDMVKACVDLGRGVMAIGGELHADEEAMLIADGAAQADVWGINLYPDEASEHWVEFDSMINVRPRQGNRSRGIESTETQARIRDVVTRLVER